MAQPPRPALFRAARYELADAGLWLSPVATGEAGVLSLTLAAIDPWARLGISAATLEASFAPADDGGIRLAVRPRDTDAPIGIVILRHPWLVGPYIQIIGLLPAAHGRGYGRAVLEWVETEARAGGQRNLWICVTAFNERALRLYARCGFERVAVLDDLLRPGIDEILMRKKL